MHACSARTHTPIPTCTHTQTCTVQACISHACWCAGCTSHCISCTHPHTHMDHVGWHKSIHKSCMYVATLCNHTHTLTHTLQSTKYCPYKVHSKTSQSTFNSLAWQYKGTLTPPRSLLHAQKMTVLNPVHNPRISAFKPS